MRAKHLKGWLTASKREKRAAEKGEGKTEGEEGEPHWENLVELIQTAFWEGKLAEETTWQAVVMITKGRQEYRAIGLVEVMWKVVAAILHLRLTASITTSYMDFGRVAAQVLPPSRPSFSNSLRP